MNSQHDSRHFSQFINTRVLTAFICMVMIKWLTNHWLYHTDRYNVLWLFSHFRHGFEKPEVSDETGALLVYSCFITYKSFSHRPTSIEHAELLGMWTRVNPERMFFKNFRVKLFENGKRYAKSETTIQKALEERIPNHILHVQFERKTSVSQSNLLYP